MSFLKELKKKIAPKDTLPSILLLLNSFVWIILTYIVFNAILNELNLLQTEKILLFTMYFLGILISAIIGSEFFARARIKLLHLWLVIGAVVTLLLITVFVNDIITNALLGFFLGVSMGIGLPSCLSYFADSTTIENRGTIGGIAWSGIGLVVLCFTFLIYIFGTRGAIFALAFWRFFGFLSFLLITKHREKFNVQKSPSYLELFRKKDIMLYLFPWIMFSIINFSEIPILEKVFGSESFIFMQFAEYVFASIFASVGGIMTDIVGRKRIIITGFVMLGIEYAAMSVFAGSLGALYLFIILDGITWGFFFSVFLTTIWGDLGEDYEKEKYYALGGLPFLLAKFASILIEPYVDVIPSIAAFSFASFFLFLAVIPLMYAPETLPEKTLRERELMGYVEKAKKIREKFT